LHDFLISAVLLYRCRFKHLKQGHDGIFGNMGLEPFPVYNVVAMIVLP